MRYPVRLLLLAAALFLLSSRLTPAPAGNYQDYIVGERASGMGGAVTATAESVDAVFFNPAGLADVASSSISLSASLYGFQSTRIERFWHRDHDLEVSSFVTIPTTFGSVWKLSDRAAAAFAAFVPKRAGANELIAFPEVEHFFKYSLDDQTLWIGPSLGWRFDEVFSLGISVFGVYRTYSNFQDFFYRWQSASQDMMYSNLSLLAVLGARYNLDEHWLLGLRFQTPNLNLQGSGDYLFKSVSWGQDELIRYSTYVEDADFFDRLPARFTTGVAYREEGIFTLGADISLNFPQKFNLFEGHGRDGVRRFWPIERRFTIDLNLGGEYFVAESYPVRLGFFTSRSSSPDPEPAKRTNPPRIDKYGLTASVGQETANTTINLGLNYVWGSGKALERHLQQDVVDVDYSAFYIFVSSSYLF